MTKDELKAMAINVLEMMAETTLKMRGQNRGEVKHRSMFREVKVAGKRWLADRAMIDLKTDTVNGDGFAVTAYGLEVLDGLKKTTQQANEVALLDRIIDAI
jgi:hypothetical protein